MCLAPTRPAPTCPLGLKQEPILVYAPRERDKKRKIDLLEISVLPISAVSLVEDQFLLVL